MALRCFLRSKLHRATITGTNKDYSGSIAIDAKLMQQAGIAPFERVEVYNVNNGERLATYAIEGDPGEVCLFGAAALKGEVGQKVIICTYAWLEDDEARIVKPTVITLGDGNTIVERE